MENQCSSEVSSSSPPIPASRVVPRAKALAAANAELDRSSTCGTSSQQSMSDAPKRGRPRKMPLDFGNTPQPMSQRRGKSGRFQRKYQKVPLPKPPPLNLSSSGGDTTKEDN